MSQEMLGHQAFGVKGLGFRTYKAQDFKGLRGLGFCKSREEDTASSRILRTAFRVCAVRKLVREGAEHLTLLPCGAVNKRSISLRNHSLNLKTLNPKSLIPKPLNPKPKTQEPLNAWVPRTSEAPCRACNRTPMDPKVLSS